MKANEAAPTPAIPTPAAPTPAAKSEVSSAIAGLKKADEEKAVLAQLEIFNESETFEGAW